MKSIEQRLAEIEQRNVRVEADKAWETSLLRKSAIAGITYVVACAFLALIGTPNWPLAALTPVLGYLLSTVTLGWVKSRWVLQWMDKRHRSAE